MMGAAMLKRHQFVWSLWALYRLVVSSITWGSQAQPLSLLLKLNRYRRLEIWRPPLALCQMRMVYGKGKAGATDLCTKLSEMNNK